jgi:nicotinamidase-related amidase
MMAINLPQHAQPHRDRLCLLSIDMQRDFVLPGGTTPIQGSMAVIEPLRQVMGAMRQAGRSIVHVVRLYQPDGSNAELCRRGIIEQGKRIVTPGSDGSQIVAELLPDPDLRLDPNLLLAGKLQAVGPAEWIMFKPRWGAFFSTLLDQHLRTLGVDTVVFGGCNFPNCPRASIFEASERDYRIILLTDATSGVDDRSEREASSLGVVPMRTTGFLAWLGLSKET